MAKSDYFGLGYIVSVILAIIPPTSCICGAITRISEGKIVAGILRILLGWNVIWVCDLVLMIVSKHILRLLNVWVETWKTAKVTEDNVLSVTFACSEKKWQEKIVRSAARKSSRTRLATRRFARVADGNSIIIP